MNSRKSPLGFGVSLAAGLLMMSACAGPDPSENPAAGDDDVDESSSSAATTGSGSSTTSGGGEECGAGDVDQGDACEVCVAESCTMEALACCEQPGCLDIIHCAKEKNCNGIECYSPDTCQTEIDAAGGPVVATQYAQPLGDCAIENCSEACGP